MSSSNGGILDLDGHMQFVTNEFRRKFRSVVDQITLPIPQRVDQYTCWPGLTVVRGPSEQDVKLELSFKRNPSKLRVTEHVYVNDINIDPKDVISGPQGVIESIDEATGRVIVKPAFQQAARFDHRFRPGLRIVLDQTLPGEHTSRELPMLALRMLAGDFGVHPRLLRIRTLLDGEESPRATGDRVFSPAGDPELERLTEAQTEAVRRAVETNFALIQGPPGTGKTHVLGLIIRELVRRGLKVGVCALTHEAINNVLEECLRYEDDISEVCKLGTRNKWRGRSTPGHLRIVERPASFFRQKSVPPVTGFTQYACFNPVARALTDGLEAALPARLDVIVFDEAGQLTVPAAVMAMVQAERFVFAGDHKQLPPVVNTVRPGDGFGISVFQHLVEQARHEAVLLDRTFRLNDELVKFPSTEFYGGRLTAAPSAAGRRLELTGEPRHAEILAPEQSSTLALVRHEGRGQESPEEAALVAALVDDAIACGVPPQEIAVVAPHRRQNVKIREMLARLGHVGSHPVVDTVERVQGQERDLVILSMTLSDPDMLTHESDFLFLPNRFNVATTRARRKLVVVASPQFFRTHPSPYALARRGGAPLLAINVLKRWYFRHRRRAVDATDAAIRALEGTRDRHPTAHEGEGNAEASAS